MGVVVLMLAIVCTLGVAWVMSMDVNEVEVTKYASLVDITDQFETEKSPEYITYNPSSNYTGYYTDDSIIGTDKYFDGVEYSTSNPNNYRLNLAPTASDTGSIDLTTVAGATTPTTVYIIEHSYERNNNFAKAMVDKKVVSLSSVLDAISVGNSYNQIILKSAEDYDPSENVFGEIAEMDVCFFITRDNTIEHISIASDAALTINPQQPNAWRPISVSASIDFRTNSVNLYYDNEQTVQRGIFTLDDVYVVFNTSQSYTGSNPNLVFVAGKTLTYDAKAFPDPEYMDPSKGVSL